MTRTKTLAVYKSRYITKMMYLIRTSSMDFTRNIKNYDRNQMNASWALGFKNDRNTVRFEFEDEKSYR